MADIRPVQPGPARFSPQERRLLLAEPRIGQRVVEAQRGARAGCGVVVRHLEHLGDDSAQIQRGREARGVGGAG